MKKFLNRIVVVNTFGAIGYFLLVTTWCLFISATFPFFIESHVTQYPVGMAQSSSNVAAVPSAALIVVGYIITAIIITVSIGVLATLPYFIGKWGSRMTRWLLRALKVSLTRRSIFLTKCILIVLPLVGMLGLNEAFGSMDIAFASLYVTTVALAIVGMAFFFIQLLFARRFSVSAEKMW